MQMMCVCVMTGLSLPYGFYQNDIAYFKVVSFMHFISFIQMSYIIIIIL